MPPELNEPATATRPSSRWRLARDPVAVLLVFALGGVLCGLLWVWWWSPPSGVVVDHRWYADLDGVRELFSGTALYVIIALVAGLVLGAGCAWLFDRVELVTLAAVAVGSVLAAWLMYQTGTSLAPPDPQVAAASAPDDTKLQGTLEVSGDSPFAAFPAGALAGAAAVFIGLTPGGITRRRRGSTG